jgi:hypothetical protein
MVSATRDKLADAVSRWGCRPCPEVLGHDDVGGEHGPGLGDLAVLLLEDDLAALAGDRRRAQLPLDRVEDVLAGRV